MTNRSDPGPDGITRTDDNEPRYGLWPFVLPFVVYMLIASRAPSLDPASIDDAAVNQYFYLVIAQVVVAAGLVLISSSRGCVNFHFESTFGVSLPESWELFYGWACLPWDWNRKPSIWLGWAIGCPNGLVLIHSFRSLTPRADWFF